MRRLLLLVGLLLLSGSTFLAWPRSDGMPDAAARVEIADQSRAELASEPEALASQAGAVRASADAVRFEPLPEDPTEILVHVVDNATEEPILDAEVYVLEVDD